MKNILLFLIVLGLPVTITAQNISIELNKGWQFYHADLKKWYKATVPGTIHTDLLDNILIPDPYYRDNESKLQWIGERGWTYKTNFDVDNGTFNKKNIELVFDGLDTYADVYLNGKMILRADNMFRRWTMNVKPVLKRKANELLIVFHSAQKKVDSIAKSMLPFTIPDNPRLYARKAQYHFGWDWGPRFVTCGIWKKILLNGWNGVRITATTVTPQNNIRLIQKKDSIGTSFYFERNGKPVYAKGANWIPAEMFLPRLKKADYRKLLQSAKDANMNMLRVWGGGVYEADEFYDLCDEMGIMVWQDFMFAGSMVPGDAHFFNNVREEVKYQIERLRHHPSIVLWCGNNEIDEAWNNWGWQNQFNLHGTDSARIWNDYKRLFRDSLPKWVNEFDGTRPYTSTSPLNGWGREKSLTEGDSHYWGVWWGMQPFEIFETKTGRFVSEYGMQAMPNMNTVRSFTAPGDRYLYSPVLKAHQKHPTGYQNIKGYLHRYFLDSGKVDQLKLADYVYLSQCLQYYALKNIIAIHRSKYPVNMGTLLWQLNDCWPVASWSITDYSREPKAAWYAVKEAYRDDVLPKKDSIYPRMFQLEKPSFKIYSFGNSVSITSNVAAKYIYLSLDEGKPSFSDNYFDLEAGETKKIQVKHVARVNGLASKLKIQSLYDVLKK